MRPRGRELLTGDIEWARHYLAPWLGKGIRRLRTGYGIERKRPIPAVLPQVEKSLRPICASLRRRAPGRRTRLGRYPVGSRRAPSRCAGCIRSARRRVRASSGSG